MKRIILLIVLLWALSCFAAPVEEPDDAKNMHKRLINNGTLSMQNTNYGFTEDLQYRRLQKLLYVSASWVSGKIQRPDEQGRKLDYVALVHRGKDILTHNFGWILLGLVVFVVGYLWIHHRVMQRKKA